MKKNILVADDNIEIVNTLSSTLSTIDNYKIDTAYSGLEILEKIEDKQYDVLISDIDFGMGLDGIEVAEVIRESNNNIKIIFFSAYEIENYEFLENSLNTKFLKKPIESNLLIKLIENE